jgi:putative acetyltransferase
MEHTKVVSGASMPSIVVRPFRPGDVAVLISIFRAAVREIAVRDYTKAQILAWAPDLIDSEKFGHRCAAKPTWVAEADGRIAGFSDLEPDGHIDMLYVDPRFARRGVARALLSHIEGIARTQGLDRLFTEASISARQTFEAVGFEVLASQTVTVRGETMTNYRMEKRLLHAP